MKVLSCFSVFVLSVVVKLCALVFGLITLLSLLCVLPLWMVSLFMGLRIAVPDMKEAVNCGLQV